MKRIGLVFPKITTNLAIKIIFEKRKKKILSDPTSYRDFRKTGP